MPRIIDLPDDDDGPLGLYAPLREPVSDGDAATTPGAIDALRSVVARPQPGYGTNPGGVMQPDAPASRALNQVIARSGGQQLPYPQEADAWRPPEGWPITGALDELSDAVTAREPAASDANTQALYAQLRQQQRRAPPPRQQTPPRPRIPPPPAPRAQVPHRQPP